MRPGLPAAALVLAILSPVCACGRSFDPDAPRKLLLIGVDGAEWDLIEPMAAAGELPNLKRLIDEGARGRLRSLEPPASSPAIWTTIATGKSPPEHGILGYMNEAQRRPANGTDRRAPAIWEIASKAGRTVGVVGWLASWPAEPVNGVMVTDYIQYHGVPATRPGNSPAGRTHPPALAAELEPLVLRADRVGWGPTQRFVDAPLDAAPIGPELERLLRPIAQIAAADESFVRMAERLYPARRPDLFAVYLRGTDDIGHHYWNFMTGASSPQKWLDPRGVPYLKGTVRAYYRYTDELVGRLLALADEGTVVALVSDHGFRGGVGDALSMHTPDGVLLLAGRGVRPGEVEGASVYDVMPTLLVLLGLRPAKDMRGRTLWAALDPAFPKERFAPALATYGARAPAAPGAPAPGPADAEVEQRLRSLGYIE